MTATNCSSLVSKSAGSQRNHDAKTKPWHLRTENGHNPTANPMQRTAEYDQHSQTMQELKGWHFEKGHLNVQRNETNPKR